MESNIPPAQSFTNPAEQKRIPTRLKALSFLLGAAYVISLFLPSSTDSGDGNGLLVLMMGWIGPLVGIFSWYANPLWVGALHALLLEKYKRAVLLSVISILLGSQYFVMYLLNIKTSFIDSERVVEPGSGYWLWMLVLVLTCIFSVAELLSKDEKR